MCLPAAPTKHLVLGMSTPDLPNIDLYLQKKYFGKLEITRLIKRTTLKNIEQVLAEIPQHPTLLLSISNTMDTPQTLTDGAVTTSRDRAMDPKAINHSEPEELGSGLSTRVSPLLWSTTQLPSMISWAVLGQIPRLQRHRLRQLPSPHENS